MIKSPEPGSIADHYSAQTALRRIYQLGSDGHMADKLAAAINNRTGLKWDERDVRIFIYCLPLKQGYHPITSVPHETRVLLYKHCHTLERNIDHQIASGRFIPQPQMFGYYRDKNITVMDGKDRIRVLNMIRDEFMFANGQGQRDFSFASISKILKTKLGLDWNEASLRSFVHGRALDVPRRSVVSDNHAVNMFDLAQILSHEAARTPKWKSDMQVERPEPSVPGIDVILD